MGKKAQTKEKFNRTELGNLIKKAKENCVQDKWSEKYNPERTRQT